MNQAIILAGGLGTRLRNAVPDLPKCMAPVAAKPFIGYLLDYLLQQGINDFIFSLGYRHALVEQYLHRQYGNHFIKCVVECEPLGTGGGLLLACRQATSENVFVLNGDTLFRVNMPALSAFHYGHGGDCTIALKPMKNSARYGHVIVDKDQSILEYLGKEPDDNALINGGVYALAISAFLRTQLPDVCSFEREYLQKMGGSKKLFGMVQDEYFIDIGIPEDYERAQTELRQNVDTNA